MSRETKHAKPGRPEGAKTIERASCIELPPACPNCHSTRREAYRGTVNEHDYAGVLETPQGPRPYNKVIWRRTKCLDCGQQLIVREFHYLPK